jgi:uncharacterized protein (DUF433 family)/DNA-binding transcriptional MerR regulator
MRLHMSNSVDPTRGVYDARRAAALAGVPKSTLNYWARTDLIVPSVAATPRPRLWSWGDLLALRAIDWLRTEKPGLAARTPMQQIRSALDVLSERQIQPQELQRMARVAPHGRLFLTFGDAAFDPRSGQSIVMELAALVAPNGLGPDLLQPRPKLRIIPGKLSGEPHIENTRIASASLYALSTDGYTVAAIRHFYPHVSREAIEEALDLERTLARAA